MDITRIVPSSRQSANCSDVVLRETTSTRLMFRPKIVDNPHSQEACVNGKLVFQKRDTDGTLPAAKDLDMSMLRRGEWTEITLHSAELLELYRCLSTLYDTYAQVGVPCTPVTLLDGSDVSRHNDIPTTPLVTLSDFESRHVRMLLGAFKEAVANSSSATLTSALSQLEGADLSRVNALVGLANLKRLLETWIENQSNSSEEFWQTLFKQNTYALTQLFTVPVIVIEEKAYVGGQCLSSSGANYVDFLAKSHGTNNAVLIEIKTPTAPLLGPKYRRDVFRTSLELQGAMAQVRNDRFRLATQFFALRDGYSEPVAVFNPKCIVIIGNAARELVSDDQKRAFELARDDSRYVEVVTYDEVFKKLQMLVDVLESGDGTMCEAA